MQFVDHDGVLTVREGGGPGLGGRRGWRRGASPGGAVIEEVPFERLKKSDVKTALDALDRKLTGSFGLFPVQASAAGASLDPDTDLEQAPRSGRVLLLVHGTFSSCQSVLGQIEAAPAGRKFLADAFAGYDHVLAFNHRTLGVSPMLNARELYKRFRASKAEVHVVCHSRGGLVTRCWLESMDFAAMARRRAVFVGSPLAGTSLAAPPNLRALLSLPANIGRALGAASAAVPFLSFAAGLFQVFSSVTSLVARTPVIDAAIGLVPGLDAQSRVGNNRIIQSFRSDPVGSGANYFAVRSNFEPRSEGWAFWRYFRDLPTRAVNLVVDPIFDGPNDLVVDVASMSSLADDLAIAPDRILDFGTNAQVHHTNYFRQARLYDFLRTSLALEP
jgi:hypothetical protein